MEEIPKEVSQRQTHRVGGSRIEWRGGSLSCPRLIRGKLIGWVVIG